MTSSSSTPAVALRSCAPDRLEPELNPRDILQRLPVALAGGTVA